MDSSTNFGVEIVSEEYLLQEPSMGDLNPMVISAQGREWFIIFDHTTLVGNRKATDVLKAYLKKTGYTRDIVWEKFLFTPEDFDDGTEKDEYYPLLIEVKEVFCFERWDMVPNSFYEKNFRTLPGIRFLVRQEIKKLPWKQFRRKVMQKFSKE